MKKLIYLFLALLIVACGSDDSSDDSGGNDSTAPIITLNGQAIATINLNSTYTDAGATATDKVDGDLTSSIVTTGVVNTSIEGDYIITYTVSDTSGNTATTTRQVIVVEDTTLNAQLIGTWVGDFIDPENNEVTGYTTLILNADSTGNVESVFTGGEVYSSTISWSSTATILTFVYDDGNEDDVATYNFITDDQLRVTDTEDGYEVILDRVD